MKTFRIVSELVYVEEQYRISLNQKRKVLLYKDRPVSTVEMYRIEQQCHFMWIFNYWKTPKFAATELFAYPNIAKRFIWSYYPDAVII